MHSRIYSAAVTILIATTPVAAQSTANPDATGTAASPSTSNPSETTTPSSSTSTTGQSATGSSETPTNVSPTPVEQNRLDPSAPSPQRLLIDPGVAAGGTATNPAENSSDPSAPGNSYNSILEGASSNNGTSTGTSGLGLTPAPSPLSPSMYPQPLTIPPTHRSGSNYPAPLTAPQFTQSTMTPGISIGTPAPASGIGTHSGLQSQAFSRGIVSGGRTGGSHR